ncbi:MAG TPA: cytochrome P450 [Candidatus Limnocylindrales bacterium]|nr:cytochrome P450 [Candidatus Limnocylindrales bacterium]
MTTATPVDQGTTAPGDGASTTGHRKSISYARRYTGLGPKGALVTGTMREYGADPTGSMRRWRDAYGDFVPVRFGPFRAHVAFGPAEIDELLTDRAADVRKSFGTRMLIPLLGNGLLTAEGDEWLRHRRLASGAFHRERIAGYGRTMSRYAEYSVESWRPGERVDLHDELTALTLRIVARTLFDTDVTPRIEELARLGTEIQDFYFGRFASLKFLIPTWLPTPGNRRLASAIRRLDDIVYGIIRERRPDEDRGDLLSMLLLARDEKGVGMPERQVRDEVMTLLLAGHETTAVALTWAFMLLDQHPEARSRLEDELRAVLVDRPAAPEDVPALTYTQAVINETLRLYPPAYVTGREAVRDTSIGDVPIPKRHIVLISMYATHRDPRFFPEPDAFRPERWLDGLEKRLPRGAFIPFGMGSRKCVGSSFAMMEATLLLATIARRWQFSLTSDTFPTHPAITLRPAAAMPAVMVPAT